MAGSRDGGSALSADDEDRLSHLLCESQAVLARPAEVGDPCSSDRLGKLCHTLTDMLRASPDEAIAVRVAWLMGRVITGVASQLIASGGAFPLQQLVRGLADKVAMSAAHPDAGCDHALAAICAVGAEGGVSSLEVLSRERTALHRALSATLVSQAATTRWRRSASFPSATPQPQCLCLPDAHAALHVRSLTCSVANACIHSCLSLLSRLLVLDESNTQRAAAEWLPTVISFALRRLEDAETSAASSSSMKPSHGFKAGGKRARPGVPSSGDATEAPAEAPADVASGGRVSSSGGLVVMALDVLDCALPEMSAVGVETCDAIWTLITSSPAQLREPILLHQSKERASVPQIRLWGACAACIGGYLGARGRRELLNDFLRLPTAGFAVKLAPDAPLGLDVRAATFTSWRCLVRAWAPLLVDEGERARCAARPLL